MIKIIAKDSEFGEEDNIIQKYYDQFVIKVCLSSLEREAFKVSFVKLANEKLGVKAECFFEFYDYLFLDKKTGKFNFN